MKIFSLALLFWMLTAPAAVTGTTVAPVSRSETVHVLFVHGIFDDGGDFRKFSKWAEARGWEAHAPDLKRANGRASIRELARQLDTYIAENIPAGEDFHVVGFSMGGIVSKEYLLVGSEADRVLSLTTIAAPHDGSWWARLLPLQGARDMRSGSVVLENQAAHDYTLPVLSVWSPYDLMILPAHSSHWTGKENIKSNALMHSFLIRSKKVFGHVAEHIEGH